MLLDPPAAPDRFGLYEAMGSNMRAVFVLLASATFLLGSGAWSQSGPESAPGIGPSGLPLPRYVSLLAEKANLRTGPGKRYPILWVYLRPGLPLKITAEYGHWRRVRDMEGTEGWMHTALLSGSRTAVITGGTRPLLRRPHADAPILMRAEAGVVGPVEQCRPHWCRMRLAGREGWVRREFIWGVRSGEIFE